MCALRGVMNAARKTTGNAGSEMFNDIAILQRKWQAALRPDGRLPSYEDVMLGSLGRLADHIVLLKHDDETFGVSRTGRYAPEMAGR